uniref:Membrane insertase YidC/Oxa/ALB C-terminal domain-containing protein n=1 Tax=Chromera velia CCMP2878 TaxID=1169474 RepID=A0A0G4FZH1_9ALVE|mmetsp:Transcript_29906/g.58663  ORF Transcript_29906/g.58663 Transcript_29906/m.58663 type:complete len:578 (-) Transcript_29906:451-2184(-)|eukprot:Cvel_19535.t1-p1 / transcript=Cvel_19535.t1 / gene=Cvel_19535 / organism=Chromera_velia_CCMP2878 / gene_product=Inner membrane protein ALBINO3, chloroplastic, putative / transcript_product=Inner membrane protein ALBINO3, chloroplastic, putative / location=Cvel_scaffold1691:34364-36272(+) / protein_length=577 / sequence_SO=supercontig / SO=protein_coding / is_pseudo=false
MRPLLAVACVSAVVAAASAETPTSSVPSAFVVSNGNSFLKQRGLRSSLPAGRRVNLPEETAAPLDLEEERGRRFSVGSDEWNEDAARFAAEEDEGLLPESDVTAGDLALAAATVGVAFSVLAASAAPALAAGDIDAPANFNERPDINFFAPFQFIWGLYVDLNSGVIGLIDSGLSIVLPGGAAVGIAIALYTLLIRALLLPVSRKSVRTAQMMTLMQPLIDQVRVKAAGDNEEFQRQTQRVYKKYDIDPSSTLVPLVVQSPVLIGLYRGILQLQEGNPHLRMPFLFLPNLVGPNEGKIGLDLSWAFPFVDGQPPVGWSAFVGFLTLPILLFVAQFVSALRLGKRIDGGEMDNNAKILAGFSSGLLSFFALSTPPAISIYWLVSNLTQSALTYFLKEQTMKDYPKLVRLATQKRLEKEDEEYFRKTGKKRERSTEKTEATLEPEKAVDPRELLMKIKSRIDTDEDEEEEEREDPVEAAVRRRRALSEAAAASDEELSREERKARLRAELKAEEAAKIREAQMEAQRRQLETEAGEAVTSGVEAERDLATVARTAEVSEVKKKKKKKRKNRGPKRGGGI